MQELTAEERAEWRRESALWGPGRMPAATLDGRVMRLLDALDSEEAEVRRLTALYEPWTTLGLPAPAERARTPATTAPSERCGNCGIDWAEHADIRNDCPHRPPAEPSEPFPRVTAEDFAKLRAVQAEGERLGALTDCIDRELADEPSADAASECKRLADALHEAAYDHGSSLALDAGSHAVLNRRTRAARHAVYSAIDALAARVPTVTAARPRPPGVVACASCGHFRGNHKPACVVGACVCPSFVEPAATAEPPAEALGSSLLDEVRRLDAVVQATHRYLDAHGVPGVVEGSSTLKERVHWLAEQRGCAEAEVAALRADRDRAHDRDCPHVRPCLCLQLRGLDAAFAAARQPDATEATP